MITLSISGSSPRRAGPKCPSVVRRPSRSPRRQDDINPDTKSVDSCPLPPLDRRCGRIIGMPRWACWLQVARITPTQGSNAALRRAWCCLLRPSSRQPDAAVGDRPAGPAAEASPHPESAGCGCAPRRPPSAVRRGPHVRDNPSCGIRDSRPAGTAGRRHSGATAGSPHRASPESCRHRGSCRPGTACEPGACASTPINRRRDQIGRDAEIVQPRDGRCGVVVCSVLNTRLLGERCLSPSLRSRVSRISRP